MFRNFIHRLSGVICMAVFLSGTAWSQAAAVQALQRELVQNGAAGEVKINGLHMTSDLMGRPTEMRVQNGVVSRGASRWVHGDRDTVISAGQRIQFQRVEAAQDAKNDLLRVYVNAMGSLLPVSFVLPKGSLASMDEAQMRTLVETVFQPLAPVQSQPPSTETAPAVQPQAARPTAPAAEQAPERSSLPSENVLELDGILKKHNGDAILKIEGVHAAMQSPDYTRDNIIAEGVFQPRPVGGIYRGMRDMVLWPNSHVTFMQVAAFTSQDHDILHLIVRSDLGAFAPITFLLPKGQLGLMSKRQIMAAFSPFIVFAAADENSFRTESSGGTSKPVQHDAVAGSSLRPSRPPLAGCMWVPYVSKKWSLELLREHCTGTQNDWKLSDMADGIGMSLQGPAEGAAIQILSKQATQSPEAAIQQQIIARFQDPAARAHCTATRSKDEEEPGWHEYDVQAVGAYAHPKPIPGQDGEKGDPGLCGGLFGGDVSNVFVYNPEVSRTHFFALYGLSDPLKEQPFDIFSLRFLSK